MEQISYKGYAQRTAFDPLRAPDETAKILQDGQRTLRGMENLRDQERRNRDAYLQGMLRKQEIEESQRQVNKRLEDTYRETYQQAKLRNEKARVDSGQAKYERNLESLAGLSEGISKMVVDLKEKRDTEKQIEGYQLVYTLGAKWQEYLALKAGEADIEAKDTAYNAIIEQLRNRGISESQIEQLRNLSGQRLYGAMKAFATQGVQSFEEFRSENADREFDINGQTYTMSTAINGGMPVKAAIDTILRGEFFEQFKGMDSTFLNEYLMPGMRKIEERENAVFADAYNKNLALIRDEEDARALRTDIDSARNLGRSLGDASQAWIMRTSGGTPVGLRRQRAKLISIYADMAAVGEFTINDLESLGQAGVILKGSAKEQLFKDLYKKDYKQLEDAIQEYNKEQYNDFQSDQTIKKEEFIRVAGPAIREQIAGKSEKEIRAIYDAVEQRWMELFNESPPQVLRYQEQMAVQEATELLDRMKNDGTLSKDYLYNGKFSAETIAKYEQYATNYAEQAKLERTQAISGAKGALSKVVNTTTQFKEGEEEAQLLPYIQSEIDTRAYQMIRDGAEPGAAYTQAGLDVSKQIKDGEGKFAREEGVNGRFLVLGKDSGQLAQRQRREKLRTRISEDNSLITKEVLLTPEEVQKAKRVGNGGSMPHIVTTLQQFYPTLSPYEIIERQLELAGETFENMPPEGEVYGFLPPELRMFTTYRPSLSRTARATRLATGATGKAAFEPLLNLIASKESRSTDPANDGYDAINLAGSYKATTFTERFGRRYDQFTVAEIRQLQDKGIIHATGRNQIIGITLQSLIDQGVVSPNEMYTEDVQDKAAIALVNRRAGKFFAQGGQVPILGMGQEWEGLKKVDPAYLTDVMQQVRTNLQNERFDVERMRPEIVYRVGNIGPTSTGSHLDVKDVKGTFFGRKSLDEYIGFQTAEGTIPLSAGVTVSGGEFGASRSYGQHLGWDYAMPAGTPVVLRNGARPISSVRTEHGEKLTIGLPDGRRFTFLHGETVQ
jgi:hypothetical protein